MVTRFPKISDCSLTCGEAQWGNRQAKQSPVIAATHAACARTRGLSWGCNPHVSHWAEEFLPGLQARGRAASPYNKAAPQSHKRGRETLKPSPPDPTAPSPTTAQRLHSLEALPEPLAPQTHNGMTGSRTLSRKSLDHSGPCHPSSAPLPRRVPSPRELTRYPCLGPGNAGDFLALTPHPMSASPGQAEVVTPHR